MPCTPSVPAPLHTGTLQGHMGPLHTPMLQGRVRPLRRSWCVCLTREEGLSHCGGERGHCTAARVRDLGHSGIVQHHDKAPDFIAAALSRRSSQRDRSWSRGPWQTKGGARVAWRMRGGHCTRTCAGLGEASGGTGGTRLRYMRGGLQTSSGARGGCSCVARGGYSCVLRGCGGCAMACLLPQGMHT